jgi:peptidoglycan/LPS O-acetylase OafA/YrhL
MTGVSFFFILSGFLLAWTARDRDTKLKFWQRRFARIYPAYAVAWLTVAAFKFTREGSVNPTDYFALSLLQDWVPQERFYFGATAVFWSLSCEAFFYLAFPFIFPLLARLRAKQRLVLFAGIAVAVVAIAAVVNPMIRGTVGNWFLYIFPPVRFLEFVVGMLAAIHLKRGRVPNIPLWAALGLFGVAYAGAVFAPASFAPVSITLVPLTLVVIAAAQADLAGSWSPFRGRALVELGGWSYSFYLLHTTCIAVWFLTAAQWGVDRATASGWVLAVNVLGALALSLAVSALLYRLVEVPAERRLRPRGSRHSAHDPLVHAGR